MSDFANDFIRMLARRVAEEFVYRKSSPCNFVFDHTQIPELGQDEAVTVAIARQCIYAESVRALENEELLAGALV